MLQWDPPLARQHIEQIGRLDPTLLLNGDVALLALILYLWQVHPRLRDR